MWRNFFSSIAGKKPLLAILLPIWVIAGFFLAQLIVTAIIYGIQGVGGDLTAVNQSLLSAVVAAMIYVLSIVIVVWVPWRFNGFVTTRQDLGLGSRVKWMHLLLGPAGFIVYVVILAIVMTIAKVVLPFVDFEQPQDVGFDQLFTSYEYILAFVTLVVIAPIAEEILFRGYLFGKLKKHVPIWAAILITSFLFAIAHGAWNVGIDVFVLSIVLCLLRVISGSLWPSILLHMIKNGVAFYFLFISPTFML